MMGKSNLKESFQDYYDGIGEELRPKSLSISVLLLLLVIPMFNGSAMWFWSQIKGPFWLGTNLDPDYVYLMNSLAMTQGKRPQHIHHPGTPLQVFCSLVLTATHTFDHDTEFVRNVLKEPEPYMENIRLLLSGCLLVLLIAIGIVAFRFQVPWFLIIFLQLSPLLSLAVLHNSLSISPEAMIVIIEMLYVLLLLLSLHSAQARRNEWLWATAFGVLTGFAIALKFTTAPLAVLTLFVLSQWRTRAAAMVWAVGSLLIGISPILDKWMSLVKWICILWTHSGMYGRGPQEYDVYKTITSLGILLLEFPVLAILTVTGFIVCIRVIKIKKQTRTMKVVNALSEHKRVLQGLVLFFTIQFLMVAKQPWHPDRYLFPALCFIGFMVYILAVLYTGIENDKHRRRFFSLFLCFCIVLAVYQIWQFSSAGRELRQQRDEQLSLASYPVPDGKVVIKYYRSSGKDFALAFGDSFTKNFFSKKLAQLYGNKIFYDIFQDTFVTYKTSIPEKYIFREISQGTVLMQGTPPALWKFKANFPDEVLLELRAGGKVESLFEVSLKASLL